MKLYFAAPLFCDAEKEFNERLTLKIEKLGYEVFLPQRDGKIDGKDYKINFDSDRAIFELDKKEMLKSDIFLFVLDGRVPDEGACVALGMSYMQKIQVQKEKLIIGFHTDKRGVFNSSKLNPMIKSSIDKIFEDDKSLLEFLKLQIK